ncbi:platelet endothelial cell adhesion molecule isoform X2 [Dendrobates tinctorius]|uniref:platelet endothelial cell adhesion molecule isoform X2 n=1 Tax=Dendrobates tinctorius TaxID=92724 RepID=UPI003CCA61C8
MYFGVVVTVLGLWTLGGEASDFTINSIELKALPSTNLNNGNKLELKCEVGFAKTTDFTLNSTFTFYKEDETVGTIISTQDYASYVIPKVRVSNSGQFKCEVSVAGRIKISDDIEIRVTGLSGPLINVSKDEVSEGDEVIVRCEAPEEWSYKRFKFYKIHQKSEEVKTKSTGEYHEEVKFMIKEGENILQFKCEVQLVHIGESSPASAMKTVTVVAPFSVPRIEVIPSHNFTEGGNMSVKCSFQEGRTRSQDVKLTLQKDGHIINSSTTNTLSYHRVAMVEDMGNYTCKVESKRTSKSSSAKIDIAELFPRPLLTLKRSSKNEFINENDNIELKCSVTGLPAGASDRLEYRFIERRQKRKSTRKGGKFTMTAIEKYSGSYVCQVTIANITKESESLDLQIYAPVKNPVLTHIMRSNKTVVLGDTLELTCKIQSGTPPITYSLVRGKDLLEKQIIYGDKEARFLVNSSSSHDLGQYSCQATNRNTQSTGKYSNIVNVTVIIPISTAHLKIIPSDGDVEEGSNLTLVCQVEVGTLPITFLFYRKKGNEVLLQNVTETQKQHSIHHLPRFSKQEDGNYFCAASNRAQKEVRSQTKEARAVLATWKKGLIGSFVLLIVLAATAICAYLHMDKKKRGKDITLEKTRSAKIPTTNCEKPTEETKGGEPLIGNFEGDEQRYVVVKSAEESTCSVIPMLPTSFFTGNNQHNHEGAQSAADTTSTEAEQGDPNSDDRPPV